MSTDETDEAARTFTIEQCMRSRDLEGDESDVQKRVESEAEDVLRCLRERAWDKLMALHVQPTWKTHMEKYDYTGIARTRDMIASAFTQLSPLGHVYCLRVHKGRDNVARKLYDVEVKYWSNLRNEGKKVRCRLLARFMYEGDCWYVNPRSLLRIRRV